MFVSPCELRAIVEEASASSGISVPPALAAQQHSSQGNLSCEVNTEEESVFSRYGTEEARKIIGDIALYDYLGSFIRRALACLDDVDYSEDFKDPLDPNNQII